MNAARKKAAEAMEKTDMIIEVLDARVPQASRNPMITALSVRLEYKGSQGSVSGLCRK